jgi:hypothetical protein
LPVDNSILKALVFNELKKSSICFLLTKNLKNAIDNESNELKISKSNLIRAILQNYFENKK